MSTIPRKPLKQNKKTIVPKSTNESHANSESRPITRASKHNTNEVTQFQSVLPSAKKTQRSMAPITGARPGTFTSPPVLNELFPKSFLTSRLSRPRPTSAQVKALKGLNETLRKIPGTSIVIPATQQKPQRPNTAQADFASGASRQQKPFDSNPVKSSAPASTNAKPKVTTISNKAKAIPQTKVVLAPRFGPESSEPSTMNVEVQYLAEEQEICPPRATTAPPCLIWGKQSSTFVLNPNNHFTPEKARWVQMALNNLGEHWVAQGAVPPYMMEFPEFQEKIGELYDIAVSKKHSQISNQDAIDITEMFMQTSKSHFEDIRKNVPGSNGSQKHNENLTDVQKRVSDMILEALLQKLMPHNIKNISTSRRDAWTDTRMDSYDPSYECGDKSNGNIFRIKKALKTILYNTLSLCSNLVRQGVKIRCIRI
jgi:hypothetical protein